MLLMLLIFHFICYILVLFSFSFSVDFVVTDANQMSAMFAAGRAIPKIEPTDSGGPVRSSWMLRHPPPPQQQQQQQQAAPQQQPQTQSQPAPHALCKNFSLLKFGFLFLLHILLLKF